MIQVDLGCTGAHPENKNAPLMRGHLLTCGEGGIAISDP